MLAFCTAILLEDWLRAVPDGAPLCESIALTDTPVVNLLAAVHLIAGVVELSACPSASCRPGPGSLR